MEIERLKKALRKDLVELSKKYKIKNVCFTGEIEEPNYQYLGYLSAEVAEEETSGKNVACSILNVGRLWQYSRQTMVDILNKLEKK